MKLTIELTDDDAKNLSERRREWVDSYESRMKNWAAAYADAVTEIFGNSLCTFTAPPADHRETVAAIRAGCAEKIASWVKAHPVPKTGEFPRLPTV